MRIYNVVSQCSVFVVSRLVVLLGFLPRKQITLGNNVPFTFPFPFLQKEYSNPRFQEEGFDGRTVIFTAFPNCSLRDSY